MHLEIHDIFKTCNQRECNGEPRTLVQALRHLYSVDPLPPNTVCLVHAGKPHWAGALFLIVLGRDPGLTMLASARGMTEGMREDGYIHPLVWRPKTSAGVMELLVGWVHIKEAPLGVGTQLFRVLRVVLGDRSVLLPRGSRMSNRPRNPSAY